jgi:hypothetical protein
LVEGEAIMSEREFDYAIHSSFPGNSERPEAVGIRIVRMLDALTNIDPSIFKDWEVMDFPAKDSVPLRAARSHIGALIEKNVVRGELGEPEPHNGYHIAAFTGGNVSKSRNIRLRINAGGKREGELFLETGFFRVAADPDIVTYPIFKSALLAISASWPSPWAYAYVRRVGHVAVPIEVGSDGAQAFRIDSPRQVPSDISFPNSVHPPWLAHLSVTLAAGLKLAPEIPTERTPDGGLLISATTERLDLNNPDHVRWARVLAEILVACTGKAR